MLRTLWKISTIFDPVCRENPGFSVVEIPFWRCSGNLPPCNPPASEAMLAVGGRDVPQTLLQDQERQDAPLLRARREHAHRCRTATARRCPLGRTQPHPRTPLATHGRLLQPPGRCPGNASLPRRRYPVARRTQRG